MSEGRGKLNVSLKNIKNQIFIIYLFLAKDIHSGYQLKHIETFHVSHFQTCTGAK